MGDPETNKNKKDSTQSSSTIYHIFLSHTNKTVLVFYFNPAKKEIILDSSFSLCESYLARQSLQGMHGFASFFGATLGHCLSNHQCPGSNHKKKRLRETVAKKGGEHVFRLTRNETDASLGSTQLVSLQSNDTKVPVVWNIDVDRKLSLEEAKKVAADEANESAFLGITTWEVAT